jgi:hypothetical protein
MSRLKTAWNSLAGTTGKTSRSAIEALAAKGAVVGTSKIVTKTVTVALGQTTGTVTVVTGSTILGFYPAGNQDQFVDSVAIATTVCTVTLAAAATAANTYKVVVLEP